MFCTGLSLFIKLGLNSGSVCAFDLDIDRLGILKCLITTLLVKTQKCISLTVCVTPVLGTSPLWSVRAFLSVVTIPITVFYVLLKRICEFWSRQYGRKTQNYCWRSGVEGSRRRWVYFAVFRDAVISIEEQYTAFGNAIICNHILHNECNRFCLPIIMSTTNNFCREMLR